MRCAASLVAIACLTLSGCSDGATSAPSAKAESASAASPAPTETTFTLEDCKALLESNFAADANTDVSREPECSALTKDEYVQAVGDVLTGHKDDILADAADQTVYDETWLALDATTQTSVCDLMTSSSPESVGILLEDMVDDPSVDTVEMAQYFNEEKC
ncbi:hypothetical protein ACIGMX_34625 [Streptomyces aquilus]|uniref:hypothetical protein n=1 Tax=Streptomyces aquilus TaxID=2548456 RepID=UPI0037CE7267